MLAKKPDNSVYEYSAEKYKVYSFLSHPRPPPPGLVKENNWTHLLQCVNFSLRLWSEKRKFAVLHPFLYIPDTGIASSHTH